MAGVVVTGITNSSTSHGVGGGRCGGGDTSSNTNIKHSFRTIFTIQLAS